MATLAYFPSPRNTARHLWTGRFRLYVNSFREAPLIWSIDDGDPANEVKCTSIRTEGVTMLTGTTVTPGYTPSPDDQRVAKAWVEGVARVTQTSDGAIHLQAA